MAKRKRGKNNSETYEQILVLSLLLIGFLTIVYHFYYELDNKVFILISAIAQIVALLILFIKLVKSKEFKEARNMSEGFPSGTGAPGM